MEFFTLNPNGAISHVASIQINACPKSIMLPVHYRTDGTCKCDNAEHRAYMIANWEYTEDDFKRIPLRD